MAGNSISKLIETVDNASEMERFISMGVDGIITDYPDILREMLVAKGIKLPGPLK